MRYKINRPDIVLEYFEDETVLINLKNGNYYSIDKVGTDILVLIEAELSTDQIIKGIKNKYDAYPGNPDSSIEKFITQLHNEKIIRQEEKTSGRDKSSEKKVAGSLKKGGTKLTFSPPRLSKYTDMQELLLLDPIHDVDETGWPKKKPDEPFNQK